MKHMKNGIACLLAAALIVPAVPTYAANVADMPETIAFNIGTEEVVLDQDAYDENGNYEIALEENAFFPYEVQFTFGGETKNEWFVSPDDSKEIGGHTFTVASETDGTVVTQMSLDVAGEEVIVYPEEKFDGSQKKASVNSLLPLEEIYLTVDLSKFTPIELTQISTSKIFAGSNAIKSTDKIAWTRSYSKDYVVNQSGDKLDFSQDTNYGNSTQYQMIVGNADQLNMKNVRYMVNVQHAMTNKWLDISVQAKDDKGKKLKTTVSNISYYDYNKSNRDAYAYYKVNGTVKSKKIGLKVNKTVFPNVNFSKVKVYKGKYSTVKAAQKGTDITKKIWNTCNYDMTGTSWIDVTIVAFDKNGKATGCLPLEIGVFQQSDGVSVDSMFKKTGNNRTYVTDSVTYGKEKITKNIHDEDKTYTLYKGYSAKDKYAITMSYDGEQQVTAAYVGKYTSIAAAKKAKAKDIKNQLFSDNYQQAGYEANYVKGVWFTVFVGKDKDKNQQIYRYNIKTVEGKRQKQNSSDTYCYFSGVVQKGVEYTNSYVMDPDSYAENNFVTCFVSPETDLTQLALNFSINDKAKLYAEGSSSPEVSGQSFHDFSKGAIQFTVSAEDGKSSKSYWVKVIKAKEGAGELYINSLSDPSAKTKTSKNVVHTTREVMLDSYHGNAHDIMLANIGTDNISSLSVELKSNVVELDKYWTLSGKYDLQGLNEIYQTSSHGELKDMAMVRLVAKENVAAGTDVSGTLTFKSGKTTLLVMNLTGTVGNPVITTKKVPKAVKYVPYGSMIQNSNKYSWNTVSYKITKGKLPAGMKLKENGELYGVPKKSGKYKFTVEMTNSYTGFGKDTKEFTLTVVKNTNKNVDAATDKGYTLSEKIKDINISTDKKDSYLMVSQGVFGDFVDVYLDGQKLKKDKDYSAESGSTRITIKTQTLTKDKKVGSHTIGVEFRTQDTKELKRAAQNYSITSKNTGNVTKPETKKPTKTETKKPVKTETKKPAKTETKKPVKTETKKPDKTENKKTTQNQAQNVEHSYQNVTADTTSYQIHANDTLWGLAEAKYGDGNKWIDIFNANKDIISGPKKLVVGTVITLP